MHIYLGTVSACGTPLLILHHFTHQNYFQSILRDGPVPDDWRLRDGSTDRACVWLFDTPERRDYMDDRFRCLKVRVERDQVVNYADYRRDHPKVTPVVREAEARRIWLSFATIPPEHITRPLPRFAAKGCDDAALR